MSSLEPELSRLSTDEDKLPTVDLLLISFLPLFFMNMELIGEARLSQRLLWLLWFGHVLVTVSRTWARNLGRQSSCPGRVGISAFGSSHHWREKNRSLSLPLPSPLLFPLLRPPFQKGRQG
jgi:hypothetical protein